MTRVPLLRLVAATAASLASLRFGASLLPALALRPTGFLVVALTLGPFAALLSSGLLASGLRVEAWHLVALVSSFVLNVLTAPLLDGDVGDLKWLLLVITMLLVSFVATALLKLGEHRPGR